MKTPYSIRHLRKLAREIDTQVKINESAMRNDMIPNKRFVKKNLKRDTAYLKDLSIAIKKLK